MSRTFERLGSSAQFTASCASAVCFIANTRNSYSYCCVLRLASSSIRTAHLPLHSYKASLDEATADSSSMRMQMKLTTAQERGCGQDHR